MRILICLLVATIGCSAQRPENDVLAVFHQMEKAEQTGNGNAFVALWARESIENARQMGAYMRARPDAHYTSSKVLVEGDQAVLLGKIAEGQFLSMRLVKEDGSWKIKDQTWSETAPDPNAVYALLPPPAGSFERAGSPWAALPRTGSAAPASQDWQVRATYDESYLYVRIESPELFPAPGATANRPPMGWPVMKVDVSGLGDFVLDAGANIGDQATFDKTGHADSHRPFVAYSLRLDRGQHTLFNATAALHPNPLVEVQDHSFEVRVPLVAMGISDSSRVKMTLGDAQWPKSAVFSFPVPRFQ